MDCSLWTLKLQMVSKWVRAFGYPHCESSVVSTCSWTQLLVVLGNLHLLVALGYSTSLGYSYGCTLHQFFGGPHYWIYTDVVLNPSSGLEIGLQLYCED